MLLSFIFKKSYCENITTVRRSRVIIYRWTRVPFLLTIRQRALTLESAAAALHHLKVKVSRRDAPLGRGAPPSGAEEPCSGGYVAIPQAELPFC